MTTTDSNGILFLETTDPISPFQTLINGLQTATSSALSNGVGARPKICTSGTRPASPVDAQMIRETDTKAWGIWDAASASWMMFDTVYQPFALTVFFLGNAGNATTGAGGAFDAQYFRHGKTIDLNIRIYKGAGTDWGSVVGSMIIRPPSGILFSASNSWGATSAIDGFYSSSGKAYSSNTGVQNGVSAVQYSGDPNALYFQTTAGAAGVGTFVNQNHLGTTTVGTGLGSYLTLSATGIRIQ